jgi:IS605 OrfB family transposase
MIIQKAYKYQLKIAKSKQQEIVQKLASFAGCRRFVWNKALALQKTKQKLNKVHAKIGNKRKHHLHTISHTLSKKLVRQIEYKHAWNGRITIAVNPKYTSQKCSECGHIHKDNRKSQSDFTCLACGETVRPKIDVCNNTYLFEARSSLKQEPFYEVGFKPLRKPCLVRRGGECHEHQ